MAPMTILVRVDPSHRSDVFPLYPPSEAAYRDDRLFSGYQDTKKTSSGQSISNTSSLASSRKMHLHTLLAVDPTKTYIRSCDSYALLWTTFRVRQFVSDIAQTKAFSLPVQVVISVSLFDSRSAAKMRRIDPNSFVRSGAPADGRT